MIITVMSSGGFFVHSLLNLSVMNKLPQSHHLFFSWIFILFCGHYFRTITFFLKLFQCGYLGVPLDWPDLLAALSPRFLYFLTFWQCKRSYFKLCFLCSSTRSKDYSSIPWFLSSELYSRLRTGC